MYSKERERFTKQNPVLWRTHWNLSQTVKTKRKITQLLNQTLPSFWVRLYSSQCSKGIVVDDVLKIAVVFFLFNWKKKNVILFFFTCHKPIKLMSVPFKLFEIRIRKELRVMNTSKGVGFIVVDKGCIL